MPETLQIEFEERGQPVEAEEVMTADRQERSCMLLSINDVHLLVPRNVVAEVLHHSQLNIESDSGSGLDMMEWRGRDVPVPNNKHIGVPGQLEPDEDTRVAVLHGLKNREQLPYYSIVLSRGPRLLRVSDRDLEAIQTEELHPAELMRVRLEGTEVIIPDVDHFESAVLDLLNT